MKALIQHLVREHLPQIAAQSLLDCHVKGLNSIMFIDTPEQRVRLFVATKQHELHQNNPLTLGSLAAHSHHCSLTLHCIHGCFRNLQYEETLDGSGKYLPYTYQSQLLHGQGRFERFEQGYPVQFKADHFVRADDWLVLPADFIHSVHVAKDKTAAWFVYEGKEDAGYTGISYSDQPLQRVSFDGLYSKMSKQQVLDLLRLVGLL